MNETPDFKAWAERVAGKNLLTLNGIERLIREVHAAGHRAGLKEAAPDARILELAERMVAPGKAFAQLSASEGHEIYDWIRARTRGEATSEFEECDGDIASVLDALRAELAAARERIAELERIVSGPWEDGQDEHSAAIDAEFPTRSGNHKRFQRAAEMVRVRHGKYTLIALVNWLLARAETAESARDEWERRAGVQDGKAHEFLEQRDGWKARAEAVERERDAANNRLAIARTRHENAERRVETAKARVRVLEEALRKCRMPVAVCGGERWLAPIIDAALSAPTSEDPTQPAAPEPTKCACGHAAARHDAQKYDCIEACACVFFRTPPSEGETP